MSSLMRHFHYPNRSLAVAGEAMAATSHPLATLTAIETLKSGGNAVDAAVAAAALLAVVEPAMTGIGGDCFVLYAPKAGLPVAYNGSGRTPKAAELAWYRDRDFTEIPIRSPHSVTVPGAIDAWFRLVQDHGTKDVAELFLPAIRAAEQGVRIEPRVAFDWRSARRSCGAIPRAARFTCSRASPRASATCTVSRSWPRLSGGSHGADRKRSTKARSRRIWSPSCASSAGFTPRKTSRPRRAST